MRKAKQLAPFDSSHRDAVKENADRISGGLTAKFYLKAGYSLVNTGGGCMAFYKAFTEACLYVLVTVEHDADVPNSLSDAVRVGLYESGGNASSEPLVEFIAKTSTEAVERVKRGDWTKAS